MKIKNLKIREKLSESTATYVLIMGVFIAIFVGDEFYDKQEQVVDTPSTLEDFNSDGGEITREFLPGEHRIKRTRVDSFGYKTEPIDGYLIEDVTLKRIGNRNVITYVNTLPVVVEGKEQRDGTVTFDEFGEVIIKDSVKTMRK